MNSIQNLFTPSPHRASLCFPPAALLSFGREPSGRRQAALSVTVAPQQGGGSVPITLPYFRQ